MTSRTHDLGAITLLGIVLLYEPLHSMSLATLLLALFANQVGGIMPDIDQPTAPLWRGMPIAHVFGKVAHRLLGGHRFISHSLLGLGIFSIFVYLFLGFISPIIPGVETAYVWWAFVIGYTSHLIMDSFTKEGVPWFLPIPVKFGLPPLKNFRITTGKVIERFVVVPALLVACVWLVAGHYEVILDYLKHHIVR